MKDRSEHLQKLGEDWAAAERRGDTGFLTRTLADDFVAVGPRGFMLTKEQWLSRHDSGNLTYKSFGWDEVRVRVHGGTAVMTGRQTAEATMGLVGSEDKEFFPLEAGHVGLMTGRGAKRGLWPKVSSWLGERSGA